ncbi:unnamed protein product, partial [Mesorhabditis spiculigera]
MNLLLENTIQSQYEFAQFWSRQPEKSGEQKAEHYARIFQEFDSNFDLKFDAQELRKLLAARYHVKAPPRVVETFDENGDAALELFEFINLERNLDIVGAEAMRESEEELVEEVRY